MNNLLYNKLVIVFLIVFLTFCGSINSLKSENKPKDDFLIWDFNCDSITKLRIVNKDTLTPEKLIDIINAAYIDKVFLDFEKITNDTIFVKIKDSEYLTEQMGTCGADKYMILCTFTLTELKNIWFVKFDFEIGDHASPGTYNRKYYFDRIELNKKLKK